MCQRFEARNVEVGNVERGNVVQNTGMRQPPSLPAGCPGCVSGELGCRATVGSWQSARRISRVKMQIVSPRTRPLHGFCRGVGAIGCEPGHWPVLGQADSSRHSTVDQDLHAEVKMSCTLGKSNLAAAAGCWHAWQPTWSMFQVRNGMQQHARPPGPVRCCE